MSSTELERSSDHVWRAVAFVLLVVAAHFWHPGPACETVEAVSGLGAFVLCLVMLRSSFK